MGITDSRDTQTTPIGQPANISATERVFLKKIAQKLGISEDETLQVWKYLLSNGYSFSNRLLGNTPSTKILRATGPQGEKVAIKLLQCKTMKDFEKNQNEFKLMQLFNSNYIIRVEKLLEYRIQNQLLHFLIMERCLYDLNSQVLLMDSNVSHPDIYKISLDLVKGLRSIHEQNTVHLDIKPQNIVLGIDNKWKFIDMGISKKLNSSDDYVSSIKGLTLNYCSPEQYQQFYGISKNKVNKSSDIYSLGLVFLRMTGVSLQKAEVEISKKQDYDYTKIFNPKFAEYNKLINEMLSYQSQKRPSLDQIEQTLLKTSRQNYFESKSPLISPLKQHRKHNSQSSLFKIKNPSVSPDVEGKSFFDYKKTTPLKERREPKQLMFQNQSSANLSMFDTPPVTKSSQNIPISFNGDPRIRTPSIKFINKTSSIENIKLPSIDKNKLPSFEKIKLPKINKKQSSIASIFSTPNKFSQ